MNVGIVDEIFVTLKFLYLEFEQRENSFIHSYIPKFIHSYIK